MLNPSQDRQMRGQMTGAGQMMSIECRKEIFKIIFYINRSSQSHPVKHSMINKYIKICRGNNLNAVEL